MNENGPHTTVPHTPSAGQPADNTTPHTSEESSTGPDRTADHTPAEPPAGLGTVVRTPSDVVLLEEHVKTSAAHMVPGYVLLSELGSGGMGVVYKARHLKLNRVVAIKMMLGGERTGRGELIRFLAEAEAIAAVKHKNVVQVYDYGDANGRPFMALEFCPGGTLSKLLPKGHKAMKNARASAALLAQVARGVAAAHAMGIVHRDLKPGNVFLDEAGVPKVADFGLAKRGAGADVTRQGAGMGTPAYMAPEQGRDAKSAGAQADVWALGVMLYEALTGTRPFTGTVQEVMAKAERANPTPPRKAVASVPRDLELICLKCLAKVPHERYPTAKELADDLDRYERGEPISVRPAGPLERGYKWARRNKAATATIVVGAVAFIAIIGLLISLKINGDKDREKAEEIARREKAEIEKKEADDKRLHVVVDKNASDLAKSAKDTRDANARYFSQIRITNEVRSSDLNRAAKMLADKSFFPDHLRDVTWRVLNRSCNLEYLTLTKQPGAGALTVSRDGKTVALGDQGENPAIRLLDAETGRERQQLTGHTGAVNAVAFAAQTDAIASASADGTVRLWDLEKGTARVVLKAGVGLQSLALAPLATWVAAGPTGNALVGKHPTAIKFWDLSGDGNPVPKDLIGHDGYVWALASSPDGKTLASASVDRTVRLWDVSKGQARAVLKHDAAVTCVTFAPDGKTLATAGIDGILKVWSLDGEEKKSWSGQAAGVYGVSYSPDGESLASAHEGGALDANLVILWNPEKGERRYTLELAKERIRSVAFAPTGKALVAADAGGRIRFWRVNPPEEDLVIQAHIIGYSIAYSPTGDEIATGGGLRGFTGEVKLWDAKTGESRRTLGTHKGKVLAVAYAPTGDILASASEDGAVKLWNPKTGAERGVFGGHTKEVRCVAFAHEARLAASAGADQTVCVWDPDTGAERFRLIGHERYVMAVAFSPDDSTLFSIGLDATIRLWDMSTGKERAKWDGGPKTDIRSLALSLDGRTLFTGEASQVRAWDVATGTVRHTNAWHDAIFSIAVRNDRTLATGSLNGTVKLWEQDGLREVTTLTAGDSERKGWVARSQLNVPLQIKGLALSPDGNVLAGIGTDGRLRIWR